MKASSRPARPPAASQRRLPATTGEKDQTHQNAYIKLVLHALNHKTSAVNGVLLGRISGEAVEITDSVPLFHSSQIGLLPPLEIALITFLIVGYFHANERFDDLELGTVARNIADHVYRYFPQAALLLVRLFDH
ncbi:putative ER membrane protein complex subunit [Helianthus anomalus]